MMAAIAARWSLTLGQPVTPAQVMLCLIDLKLARLVPRPGVPRLVLDVAGYAAVLPEVADEGDAFPSAWLWRRARSLEEVKRDGWHEQGVLAVVLDDERLTWSERELVRQLGEKLYGKRRSRRMAEWTRDMVEERITEAAAVLKRLPPFRVAGYFGTWPEIQRTAKELAEGMPTPHAAAAAEQRRNIPHGGGDHLEPLPRARRRASDVGAGRGGTVEGAVLPVRDQQADGPPAVGICAQCHRLAAERAAGAPSARPQVCGCECAMKRVVRGCNAIDGHAP